MTLWKKQEKVFRHQIDWSDELFKMTAFADLAALRESIRAVGLVHPPLLQEKGEGVYRVVSGWRRLAVLKELGQDAADCWILGVGNEKELFEKVLLENLVVRPFNIIEKALVVRSLRERLQLSEGEILAEYLPRLGFGRNPKWLNWLNTLNQFPEPVQRAFARDLISYDLIEYFENRTPEEQIRLTRVIEELRLGKNRQKELLLLLNDLSRIKKRTLLELLQSNPVTEIMEKGERTPSQRTARLFDWLKQERFPRYEQTENHFREFVRSLRLPPTIQLKHSPYFESEWYTMELRFRTADEFTRAVNFLTDLQKHEKMQGLDKIWQEGEG